VFDAKAVFRSLPRARRGLATCALPILLGVDEGMWTFDNPPLERLKERYGFEPTKAWLDHLRRASVRINELISMDDVTARVQGPAKSGLSDREALEARRAHFLRKRAGLRGSAA
jgi:hypothetical protein